jgi:2-(1,2-epoxy-1,2-dihydrophenyl)acetyl-CoA isomerase
MKNKELLENYPDFFVSEIIDDTLWLRFSGNFFHNIIDFDRTDFLSEYFERISKSEAIKTVILHTSFSESGTDEYFRFFLFECPERNFGYINSMTRYELHRFCNIIDRMILDIAKMEKIVIHICCGNSLSLFMGISLCCDYRIIGNDTIFYNAFHEIEMLSKGGSCFFLTQMLGASKAKELLLLNRQITADQAFQQGISDLVVKPDKLEEEAMRVALCFSKVPYQTLIGVKQLINYSVGELKEYLKLETSAITRIGDNNRFDDL